MRTACRGAAAVAGAVLLLGPAPTATAARADLSPLVTRWAAGVSPVAPRPEYPRPQAVRSRWQSLNGRWRVQLSGGHARDILVPFPYQAPLSGIGRRGIHRRVVYRRTFTVPRAWRAQRVLLHFGAVDWAATVTVNGRRVGAHRGGYTPFSLDVTAALRRSGRQRLTVAVADPVGAATQPLGKQLARGTIYYTRTTGIWQTVWIEPVAGRHVARLRLEPDLASGRLGVVADVTGGADGRLSVRVARRGVTVATGTAPVAAAGSTGLALGVPSPEPWSPENPALYDVTVVVRGGAGQVTDRLRSYTAFRSVDVEGGRFRLNGRPYLLRGVLDQGYWPDGLYAAPSDAALREEVRTAKRLGFNLARKHQKVEDPRWYWWCDRLGLLVAQDMPASRDLSTGAARAQFEAEWLDLIAARREHPSVALWIAFNENWGRPSPAFVSRIVDLAHAADPTRPVVGASGSPRGASTDMLDVHDYRHDLARHDVPSPARARWIGEYGGISLKVPGHVWKRGRSRHTPGRRRPAQMLARFERLTDQLTGAAGLSGFVYTQLADVENELNGLMTYDRVLKVDPARIRAIVRRGPR